VKAIVLSASVVLYKPDLPAVERTLLALQQAVLVAKQHYALRPSLTLIDNSDDPALYLAITSWFEGFRARVPDWSLQLVQSPGNVGYGRGNNLAIAHAHSDYHAVINPDLFVDADALLEALRFMEGHADVGLLSPAVVGEDGERHYLCKRNPTLLIMFLRSFAPLWLQSLLRSVVDEFEMRDCDYDKPIHPLEYPTGCFMFFRTAPLQEIGGFDPDFFLHYEDADIGRRILKVARVFYVPSVRVTHRWARDTHRSLQAMLLTARSGLLYWRKWGGVLRSECAEEPTAALAGSRGNQGPDPATGSGRRILVTGANGFIGKAVCADLPSRGHRVRGAVRRNSDADQSTDVQHLAMGEIDEHTDWTTALSEVGSVVHLAARVHLMQETEADPLAEYRRVNVALTLNLARQAAALGIRRFVFMSSIKVNGENTPVGQPFTTDDEPRPQDPYGISKLEAEQALMQLAGQTGMEVVILRPVLVYGPGVKANFQAMMRWLRKGVPLPLGSLDNRRSLVSLDNLVDCIATCVHHPAAANQIFLVSDGEDLTVKALLQRTATAFNRRARLLPVPKFVIEAAGRVFGREAITQRLCDTLQVDISKTRCLLGWEPPVPIDDALRKTAQQFQDG
jgi:nucleoside-diphosphate-sugar epimerase/GT2 family glycosyltransferase